MAISSTFYLDSPSLSTATVIYSDISLTTIAADGFYSDGTIVREQALGVLLPQSVCESCASPCGGTISASGNQGVYTLNTDLGTDTGAVIVEFNPFTIPDGILAQFNSTYYNGLSSPSFGWLQGSPSNLPTYIGNSADGCSATLVSGSPYTLNVYNYSGGAFVATGGTETFSITAPQLQLTAGGPGNCIMVIPKTTAAPSVLSLKFIGPCLGTAFDIGVSCPAPLTSYSSGTMQATSGAACLAGLGQTYYVAHVTGSAGNLGLYDLVFSNSNGSSKLSAGFYATSSSTSGTYYQVDSNGVIIGFGACP
jgi:hypothetical protein